MRFCGIDEAGYGPTLGPLGIVRVVAEADDRAALTAAFAATGVRDSKEVHDPKDLAPLESVALAAITWACGFQPDTAADCFALLGETAEIRRGIPWMAGAADLRLPVAASAVPTWDLGSVRPRGLGGSLVQPREYNATLRIGCNKAVLEWRHVARLLVESHDATTCSETVVDRLGGRKFYGGLLQEAFPAVLVLIEQETDRVSRYRLPAADHDGHGIGFYVGGEAVSPLTAVASCIAKYARELHMLLLNRYWCTRMPWLAPTAGYPQDAKRWLHQLGTGYAEAWIDDLVRKIVPDDPQ